MILIPITWLFLVLIVLIEAKMDLTPTLQQYAPNVCPKLASVLSRLLEATGDISKKLREGTSHEQAGTQNRFGDNQLEVDIATDKIVFDALKSCGHVSVASSEETPEETDLGGEGYSVGFDPLDGSSIIDANFAVGSIFGVWPGRGLLNRTGREQSASVLSVYGPRTTAAIALSGSVTGGDPVAFEVTLSTKADQGYYVSKERLVINPSGKTFAPGNLRATSDFPKYRELVDFWIKERYTLRYSGGLVPDVYHIFIKSKGILTNVSSATAQAKLRLLYECAPVGLLVEAAGGATCIQPPFPPLPSEDSGAPPPPPPEPITPISILDVPIDNLDKRVGVCYGSTEEVDIYKRFLF
uniref:Fructose-bisphosphatase n=1 Tax=Fibrocapsa japonica TaxID=94617 RepID=A0A7S2UUN7_9STRA|mmetsp:Transcript_14291/g.21019  ORF Transcript_14291/g.21019 Transcript_14291/m.21019 type:complete len:354 (+) Transcript_14291:87-1148(+)